MRKRWTQKWTQKYEQGNGCGRQRSAPIKKHCKTAACKNPISIGVCFTKFFTTITIETTLGIPRKCCTDAYCKCVYVYCRKIIGKIVPKGLKNCMFRTCPHTCSYFEFHGSCYVSGCSSYCPLQTDILVFLRFYTKIVLQ